MSHTDYWAETISEAACECGLSIAPEQLVSLSKAVEMSHDNYGQCFYQPPASDMVAHEEREQEKRYKKLQKEFDDYRSNAETAVKQALRVRPDSLVGIGEHGEVTMYGGRIERIQ